MSAGQRYEGGEHGTFFHAGVFGHLHQNFLAPFDNILDGRGFTGGCFLEIVAVNFMLLEKTVSFGAVVDKSGLKTWLDSGDNRLYKYCRG